MKEEIMKLDISEAAGIGGAIFVVAIIALAGYGWVVNSIKMVGMDFSTITGMMVVRAIGIFMAPLGAVMGYL